MAEQLKLGFIGTGGIAHQHLKNLATFEDVRIVGLCDTDEAKAEATAGTYGGAAYSDFHRMLDETSPDALYICTPPFAHGDAERAACAAGIPMFVEKPIATNMELALELDEAIRDAGIVTSVGYHWRYRADVAKAAVVLEGEKILAAMGYWIGGLPGVSWWRVRDQSGGQHVEQTTHIFDLCRYLVGSPVTSVFGLAGSGGITDVPHYDVDDVSVVALSFANGAVATMTSSCAMKGWSRVGLELLCPGLLVEVGREFLIRRGEDVDESTEGYVELDRDRVFIDAARSGDSSDVRSDYHDALETLRVTLAASDSFSTGRVVEL